MTAAPPPIIHLEFQLTAQDYARANWDHYRSARIMWIAAIWFGPVMLIAGIYRYATEAGHPLSFPLFLGLIFMVFIPYKMIVAPRRAFKKQPALAAPQTFQLTADGISV